MYDSKQMMDNFRKNNPRASSSELNDARMAVSKRMSVGTIAYIPNGRVLDVVRLKLMPDVKRPLHKTTIRYAAQRDRDAFGRLV